VPITIRHEQCDLIGVTVGYRNCPGGAVVGNKPGGVVGILDGVMTNSKFSLAVQKGTLDVTISGGCTRA
jgi:hypothetical protein